MLELRPDCERCGIDLPPEAVAMICSYECTFCADCGTGDCPNCGGNLERRPVRSAARLAKHPAGTKRRFLAKG